MHCVSLHTVPPDSDQCELGRAADRTKASHGGCLLLPLTYGALLHDNSPIHTTASLNKGKEGGGVIIKNMSVCLKTMGAGFIHGAAQVPYLRAAQMSFLCHKRGSQVRGPGPSAPLLPPSPSTERRNAPTPDPVSPNNPLRILPPAESGAQTTDR